MSATRCSLNPATGEPVGEWTPTTVDGLESALRSAQEAFHSWRKRPAPRRAAILFQVAAILTERQEDLARLMAQEMGKVLVEARGDVQEAIDMALYMAGEGRRMFGHTVPSELTDKFAMSLREPIGVVALITPWNFPIAVPSWKILPALVLGNTVVWKPSEKTPLCAQAFAETFATAGLPDGVLNLVFGDAEIGAALVEHPAVRMVSFTGAGANGRRIAARCGERGKRCALELGGKNAIIVLEDADIDLAVEGIVWSAFGTSGQRCTACSRVLVHRTVRRELIDKLLTRTRALRIGDPLDPTTEVGPLINQAAVERMETALEGMPVLCGGQRRDRAGWFFEPTVVDAISPEHPLAREELFGPVVAVLEIEDLAEAVRINNDVALGLSSAIYTRDVNRAFTAIRELQTGIVYVNAGTTGSEVQLPFGGTRGTGNGVREAGQAALDTFSEWKSVYVDYSGKLQRAQIDI